MARFDENFWGEKHGGYDVLYQNMKHGEQTSKDWAEFLRQYAAAEEQYCKSLQRLAKSAGAYMAVGSFASVWPVVKTSFDKLAQAHQDMSKQWQDMAKDIAKYGEGQVKKHKTVKDAQTPTVEVVQAMQHASGALQKSKEAYQSRFAEFCKARKEHASVKKADKMDADFKKTAEDYKAAVSRYNSTRDEFQAKLTDSCKAFQEQEEAHLTQMLAFLKSFAAAHEQKHVEIGEMYYEFHSNVEQLSVPKLLQDFVDGKRTGVDRPPAAEFEEVDMTLLPPPDDAESKKDDLAATAAAAAGGAQGGGSSSSGAAATMHIIIPGILKKRRVKKQKQQQQQRGSANGGDTKDSDSLDTQSKNSQPEVDDDGYIIRKEEAPKEEDSWDSDSDSGGSDGERSRTKIKVEIKPIDRSSGGGGGSSGGGSAEIKLPPRLSSTQLAGTGFGSRSKLAESGVSSSAGGGGGGGGGGGSAGTGSESSSSASAWDLLGLDLHPSASMPVTPDSIGGVSSLSGSSGVGSTPSAASSVVGSVHQSSQAGADGGSTEDREVERLWQSPVERRAAQEPAVPSAVIPGLPRPPSRRDFTGTAGSRQVPGRSSPMLLAQQQRSDFLAGSSSSGSLPAGSPFASSRGPSPMCGVAASGSASVSPSGESMPIAVALTEVLDACLTTAVASGQVRSAASTARIAGDVVISLPLSVAKLVAEFGGGVQQAPPPLVFKLVRISRLEQWQVNEQLIVSTPVERESDAVAYAFSMPALVEHLRSRLTESRTATYFNIDVAKYVVKRREPETVPLQARACWHCEPGRVDLSLEYAYNAAGLTCPRPLGSLSFLVSVLGDVIGMQSVPEGQWSSEHRKALWKVDDLPPSAAAPVAGQAGGLRAIRARFELAAPGDAAANGATAVAVAAAGSPVVVQFVCDDSTLSGVDFELVGTGYRLSLTKRRMRTGKFSVVGEVRQAEIRYV